jgi:hypothetical protein
MLRDFARLGSVKKPHADKSGIGGETDLCLINGLGADYTSDFVSDFMCDLLQIADAMCSKLQLRFHFRTVEATADTKLHLRFAVNRT